MEHPYIRPAAEADADSILAIYAPVIRETWISFELEPPTPEEMNRRVRETTAQYPWLVYEEGGAVWGYAYAHAYRARAAYQWSAETSVYIHADCRGKGIGRALYTSLFNVLRLQGYYNACAGVALPNPASVGLHRAMGFQPVGVYHEIGYKMGGWRDVMRLEMPLQPKAAVPEPPKPFGVVIDSEAGRAALASGLALLKG